jgi:hypothetical protein
MTADADLHVEVQGSDIIVTLPGTSYVVTYYRAAASLSSYSPSPTRAERTRGANDGKEFHARAWRAATNKALELGVDRVMRGGVGFSRRLFCQAWAQSQ